MNANDSRQLPGGMSKAAFDHLNGLLDVYDGALSPIQREASAEVLHIIESGGADALYDVFSDDGENSLGFFAENAEPTLRPFFQAMLSVTACLAYAAYKAEGRRYLPEDIEAIDEAALPGFFEYIRGSAPTAEACYEYFCRNVCV